jgi:predicted negative regulator of RcsB-dependent stress response
MAKHNVDSGDVEGAKPYLYWVISHGDLSGHINIARLRLGHILLEQGRLEQALDVIREAEAIEFKSLINELTGDIYIAQGKRSEAIIAYTNALALLEQSDPRSLVLKLKLDDVAGSQK